MSAYQNLPWIPSSEQFLRAMIAGGERGVQLERLRQSAEPRGIAFGGVSNGPNPLEAARTAAITGEEKRKSDQSAAEQKAWELHNSLVSRGATPQQAYEESGLGQFGLKEPEVKSDVTPISLGRGGVGLFNKSTGTVKIAREPQPASGGAEPRYTGPTSVDIFGKPAGTARLTLPEWAKMAPTLPDQVRTNSPVSQYAQWGDQANGATPKFIGTNREAKGGYKIGTVYKGLRYLGGDPHNESNWEPINQPTNSTQQMPNRNPSMYFGDYLNSPDTGTPAQ